MVFGLTVGLFAIAGTAAALLTDDSASTRNRAARTIAMACTGHGRKTPHEGTTNLHHRLPPRYGLPLEIKARVAGPKHASARPGGVQP